MACVDLLDTRRGILNRTPSKVVKRKTKRT